MSSKPKLLVVLGKKPRASKTSKRYEYDREKYFLYSSQANTAGNYLIYHEVAPYPLIKVIPIVADETIEKAYDWIKENSAKIKLSLGDYRDRIQIPAESWYLMTKNEKKLNRNYEMFEGGISLPNTVLVVLEIEDELKYIRVRGRYPTKRSGLNNLVVDPEAVKNEYIRRRKNGDI